MGGDRTGMHKRVCLAQIDIYNNEAIYSHRRPELYRRLAIDKDVS